MTPHIPREAQLDQIKEIALELENISRMMHGHVVKLNEVYADINLLPAQARLQFIDTFYEITQAVIHVDQTVASLETIERVTRFTWDTRPTEE